jgi:transcriptional regulator with XRE-family HTH domain
LALGLTQREVVERLQLRGNPTTNRTLSAMENGRGLDLGLLPDLAVSLGCTTTYLLGLTCEPSAWQPDGLTEPVPVAAPAVPAARTDPVGILGPSLPDGFHAPGRARRRAESNGSREERLA